jgi:flagellar basal-body rod modification protein FlgD
MNTVSNQGVDLAALNGTAGTQPTKNDAASADRFLKLLVAQIQNQDPLSPMDNAQVTSQMAQINTVTGIEKLNGTVEGLNANFMQMSALQGAALVGRDVVLEGDTLSLNDADLNQGGFDLSAAADTVKVEILNGAGSVLDTIDLGAQGSGRHGFEWVPSAGVDVTMAERFRVVAKAGTEAVAHTPLTRDRVDAVSTSASGNLVLELRHNGSVPYVDIKAFN